MRTFFVAALLGSTLLSPSAGAAVTPIPPILTGAPTAAAIKQRCDLFINRIKAERAKLESERGAATVAAPFSDSSR